MDYNFHLSDFDLDSDCLADILGDDAHSINLDNFDVDCPISAIPMTSLNHNRCATFSNVVCGPNANSVSETGQSSHHDCSVSVFDSIVMEHSQQVCSANRKTDVDVDNGCVGAVDFNVENNVVGEFLFHTFVFHSF